LSKIPEFHQKEPCIPSKRALHSIKKSPSFHHQVPYTLLNKIYILSKELHVVLKELCIQPKELSIPSKEPYIQSTFLQNSIDPPFANAPCCSQNPRNNGCGRNGVH